MLSSDGILRLLCCYVILTTKISGKKRAQALGMFAFLFAVFSSLITIELVSCQDLRLPPPYEDIAIADPLDVGFAARLNGPLAVNAIYENASIIFQGKVAGPGIVPNFFAL